MVGWSRLLNFLVNKQCHVYNNNKSIKSKFQIKFSESWMLEPLCSRSLWHCGIWAHPLLILLPPLSLLLLLQPHHCHQSCVYLLSDLPCDLEMFGAHIALTAVDTVAIELSLGHLQFSLPCLLTLVSKFAFVKIFFCQKFTLNLLLCFL